MHGFAGYFNATLYKDVCLSTEPSTHTPEMHSWFPIFFPLREPVHVRPGQTVSLSVWRLVRGARVWYEWALEEPAPSALHNADGKACCITL